MPSVLQDVFGKGRERHTTASVKHPQLESSSKIQSGIESSRQGESAFQSLAQHAEVVQARVSRQCRQQPSFSITTSKSTKGPCKLFWLVVSRT